MRTIAQLAKSEVVNPLTGLPGRSALDHRGSIKWIVHLCRFLVSALQLGGAQAVQPATAAGLRIREVVDRVFAQHLRVPRPSAGLTDALVFEAQLL